MYGKRWSIFFKALSKSIKRVESPYLVHVQVPVLVVRSRRLLCGEAGEEGGVGQVERGRVDPEVIGDSSADLEEQLLPIIKLK